MKILYGIQGTGHGHISRAKELLPVLSKYASVDVLISGEKNKINVNREVQFRKRGISLSYNHAGGVSLLETLCELRPISFINDISSIPLNKYNLIISDYEPISSWAAKLENVPSLALSHQAAFLSEKSPRPTHKSQFAETVLKYFAPANSAVGFHFQRYDHFIEPPIIRRSIRNLRISENNHITVYLPAFHHEVLKDFFAPFSQVEWHIFSPLCNKPIRSKNIRLYPISNKPFLDSFASCSGVICNAGFETCAEAMYLGKKLLAMPIQKQYEQKCNAAALEKLGVTTIGSLKDETEKICHWLEEQGAVKIDEIANPKKIVENILGLGTNKHQPGKKFSSSVSQLVS